MKKIFALTVILTLLLAGLCFGNATQYNLGSKNMPIPSDWFRTGRLKDFGTKWARDIDALGELGQNPGTGRVFYVNSNVTNEGDGTSWLNAKDTLDEGYSLGTTNRGDVVFVAQSHTEDWASAGAFTMDLIGVKVVCLGEGNNRPTFTFITATATDVEVDAASNTIYNARFVGDIDALIAAFDVDAAYFSMVNCEFIDLGTDNCLTWIQTDASADNMLIAGCDLQGTATAGNESWISLLGCDRATIVNNTCTGDFSVANIEMITTTPTNSFIRYNDLANLNAVDENVSTMTGATGTIADNRFRIATDGQVTWINPTSTTSLSLYENYGVNDNGETGVIIGAASAPTQ